jgi:O-acetyl-ADP-ribose deacetylase (regulator of RNase III)
VYGYPNKEVATVAFQTVADFLAGNDTIEKVSFICFDEENYALLKAYAIGT